MPSKDWYYATPSGEIVGPLAFDEIRSCVVNRFIEPSTPVRQGENGEWQEVIQNEYLKNWAEELAKPHVKPIDVDVDESEDKLPPIRNKRRMPPEIGEWEVEISARIISFPRLCCCCGRENPREVYDATYTRWTGKRVIRANSKSWEFPICTACYDWVAACYSLRVLRIWFIGILVFALLAIVLGAVTIAESGSPVLLGIGLLLFCIGIPLGISCKSKSEQCRRIRPRDAGAEVPVEYLGWYGTVHTFVLTNGDFYDDFVRRNRNKVLS